jgi:phosphatidylserine synthase
VKKISLIFDDICCFVIGPTLIAYGLSLWSKPLGWITIGVDVIVFGYLYGKTKE